MDKEKDLLDRIGQLCTQPKEMPARFVAQIDGKAALISAFADAMELSKLDQREAYRIFREAAGKYWAEARQAHPGQQIRDARTRQVIGAYLDLIARSCGLTMLDALNSPARKIISQHNSKNSRARNIQVRSFEEAARYPKMWRLVVLLLSESYRSFSS